MPALRKGAHEERPYASWFGGNMHRGGGKLSPLRERGKDTACEFSITCLTKESPAAITPFASVDRTELQRLKLHQVVLIASHRLDSDCYGARLGERYCPEIDRLVIKILAGLLHHAGECLWPNRQ